MATLVAKRCTTCHAMKPLTAFHRRTASSDGYRGTCRECRNATDRKCRPERHRLNGGPCERCQARQHGHLCFGPAAGCECRCRAMLGLEGPFEFGDPTAPNALDWGVA